MPRLLSSLSDFVHLFVQVFLLWVVCLVCRVRLVYSLPTEVNSNPYAEAGSSIA